MEMKFRFEMLLRLLGRRADDVEVLGLIGSDSSIIERHEYLGFVDFKSSGVSVILREASHIQSSEKLLDPKMLHVFGFHLYQSGYEGYIEYGGVLPGGIGFGDSEIEVIRKLGQPLAMGGGGISSVLGRPIPRWLRYGIKGAILQLQLDPAGSVQMVTVSCQTNAL